VSLSGTPEIVSLTSTKHGHHVHRACGKGTSPSITVCLVKPPRCPQAAERSVPYFKHRLACSGKPQD
jgi:hypothetical protein